MPNIIQSMSNVEEVLHAQICICVKTGQMLGSGESQVKTEPLITYRYLHIQVGSVCDNNI